MNEQAAKELIREIAAEHGIAIDRDDPILILQTATQKIVLDAVRETEQCVELALARHRSELELAAAKWHEDGKRTASQFLQHVPAAIAAGASTELNKAASATVRELEHALQRHDTALSRSTLACALSAAVAVLAAAAFIWTSNRTADRPMSPPGSVLEASCR